MKRKIIIVIVVLAAAVAAGAWWWTRQRTAAQPAAPAAAQRGGGGPLTAEGFRVTATPVAQLVPTVGTLIPRESVTLVSELPRRLVRIGFEEGAMVKRGDLLFQLDDADLRAELERLQIRRRLLADTEQRQRELLAARTTSQQDYDRALADLQLVVAEIERLRIDLAKTEIRAPFDGRIGLRRVSEGAFVAVNTPLATLQDLSAMKLDFTLPERYADEVRPGTQFTFSVAAVAEPFTGEVLAVEPQIDPATRSLVVRGLVPNAEGLLVPGMFANIEVALRPTNDGILVPTRAIVPAVTGHSVFVVVDGRVRERAVRLGLRTEDRVQILSGLQVGDIVVTSNLLRVRDGVPVQLNRVIGD